MGRRPPPPVYKRPKDLGQSRTYWWHDGWIAPELRLYAPEQERTAGDDDDEPPSPSRPSPREEHSPRGECAAEGAAAKASAEGGAGGSDERGADRPARSNLEPKKRLTWTQDLKALFRESLAATAAQGLKESPSKILEFMIQRDAGARTAGLTRTHVASYLQKYRKAQERLEIPRPRVVFDDRYAVYHNARRAMETAEMGFARGHHRHRQHDPQLVAPAPHYRHPALANAMGVPYLHHVTGASVPVVGMGTMGGVGASTYGATYGNNSIGNDSIGNVSVGNVPVAKGAHVRSIAPRPTDHVRPIAPRPTAPYHSPHVLLHPHDAKAEAEAEAEARMLQIIRLRAGELRRDRKRAAKEAAAKEAAANEGMERERARTITPEVRAEPPPVSRGEGRLAVGGSGSEGDTTTA